MAGYDFAAIEKRWQDYWEASGTFVQPNPGEAGFVDKPKYYVLDMFPYPSGAGLHVGHPEGYTATDIIARYKRMKGFNVLHPMGYDAFGLPAQQYAVEHGVHPRITTERNIANIERQIKSLGFSYDWSRRVATTDVGYYRWTQWIFNRLFNSWYDPVAGAARPIEELVSCLERGDAVLDFGGGMVTNVYDGMAPVFGDVVATTKWHELSPRDQAAVIDEHRLAYMAEVPVNWCPKLGTVLANEEVTNEGRSDRGDHPVYRRPLRQWMLRITAYADRLLADIDGVDWPESIKIMQRNWIGRSSGAIVDFRLELKEMDDDEWFATRQDSGFPEVEGNEVIRVFTTRPDTLFGATYMVLAPEHPLIESITVYGQREAVEEYVEAAARKSELERTAETKEKTGVFTGAYAINPVNKARIPIWVADYVMMGYGTGAIMAVPAHDTRDLEFAEQFGLDVIQVVQPEDGTDWRGFVGDGIAVNSGRYSDMKTPEMIASITADLESGGLGKAAVNYKLRDWIFSRQWYWGEPFPIVHCEKCGVVSLPDDQLPLLLPEIEDYTPHVTDDPDAPPEPPLARVTDWVGTDCPSCGSPARRETNAMPQWAGSCWYYLRFLDATNESAFVDPDVEKYWMGEKGIDLYVGGAEHAVLHLLYSRFWHKVLYDLGYASTPEPFGELFNQGMIRSFAYRDSRGVYVGYDDIDFTDDGAVHKQTGEGLAENVEKMSKSLKNVVNPDDVIAEFGADTFRMYEMFMGPLDASKPWNTRDVPGVHRFCRRVWRMIAGDEERAAMVGGGTGVSPVSDSGESTGETPVSLVERALHRLVKKVGEDIEAMKFNTAIAAMMEFVNTVYRAEAISTHQARTFILVLAPFAPHLAEELWAILGGSGSLAYESWPAHDESMIAEESVEMAVQVRGKILARISVPADADEEAILAAAAAEAKVAAAIAGKEIVKKIIVPGRLVNLVVK